MKLRSTELEWTSLDGEVVALEARASRYLAANPAGSLLWARLAAGAERGELIDDLVETYGLDRQIAAADVDAFLDDLRAFGLLEG